MKTAALHRDRGAVGRIPPVETGMRRRSGVLLVAGGVVLAGLVIWAAGRSAEHIAPGVDDPLTPPVALQGAVETQPAVPRPQIEPLPPRGRRANRATLESLVGKAGGAAVGDPAAVERAAATTSRAELALTNELARAKLEAPPLLLNELFEMRRAGAPSEDLRRFVRTRFPRQLKLRLLVMRWINRLDPTRRPDLSGLRPAGRPAAPLGSIQPAPAARR